MCTASLGRVGAGIGPAADPRFGFPPMRLRGAGATVRSMTILVTCASKHGATAEIAEALGRDLSARGHDVEVRRAEEVDGVGAYDAVVLGSAIYMGRWLPAATALADVYAQELAQRPTWLFSSGPLGDPPKPDPPDFEPLNERLHARGHRVLNGKLERGRLSLAERGVVRMVKAPYGDYREWTVVADFANEIASALA
jgi:menaquinone-dependent protoporphyrinogen oxidase